MQKWDELFSERIPADKGNLQGIDNGRFSLTLNGRTIPVTFEYDFGIKTKYDNHVSLKECKGFLNEHSGELVTDRLETSPVCDEEENVEGIVLHASNKPPVEADTLVFRVNGLKVK